MGGGNMDRDRVMLLALCLASEGHCSGTAAAAGGSELARATSRALLRAETLWTARPTPANMAGFGAAPPSASVVTVNVYNDIQPSPRRQSGAS
jgi:hypothetical protein